MKGLLALYLGILAVSLTSFSLDAVSLGGTWVKQRTPSSVPVDLVLSTSYGLFSRCDSSSYFPSDVTCRPFPDRAKDCGKGAIGVFSSEEEDEEEERWDLCDSWITAGYAQQLSLVFSLGNLLAIGLTLWGTATVGRGYRTERLRSGWKLVAGLMSLQALCALISTSLIAFERNHDRRFSHGAHLARSWTMSTVGYALNFAAVAVLLFVRATGKLRIVPGEDGYAPIDDTA
ncbi:hypothetical protein JCM8547_007602 [Rhodosporidiobolus lusitaniae]